MGLVVVEISKGVNNMWEVYIDKIEYKEWDIETREEKKKFIT